MLSPADPHFLLGHFWLPLTHWHWSHLRLEILRGSHCDPCYRRIKDDQYFHLVSTRKFRRLRWLLMRSIASSSLIFARSVSSTGLLVGKFVIVLYFITVNAVRFHQTQGCRLPSQMASGQPTSGSTPNRYLTTRSRPAVT